MAKKIIIAGIITLMTLAVWTAALTANAQPQPSARPPIIPEGAEKTEPLLLPKSTGEKPEEYYFGGVLLPKMTTTVISIAGGTAVLFIIIGGIQILTAYGNDEKINKAKKTITYAIIGLLVAILSYAIVSIISAIKL